MPWQRHTGFLPGAEVTATHCPRGCAPGSHAEWTLALLKAECPAPPHPMGGSAALIHPNSGVLVSMVTVTAGERHKSLVVHCGISPLWSWKTHPVGLLLAWVHKGLEKAEVICDMRVAEMLEFCYCSIAWHILTDTTDSSSTDLTPCFWAFGPSPVLLQ